MFSGATLSVWKHGKHDALSTGNNRSIIWSFPLRRHYLNTWFLILNQFEWLNESSVYLMVGEMRWDELFHRRREVPQGTDVGGNQIRQVAYGRAEQTFRPDGVGFANRPREIAPRYSIEKRPRVEKRPDSTVQWSTSPGATYCEVIRYWWINWWWSGIIENLWKSRLKERIATARLRALECEQVRRTMFQKWSEEQHEYHLNQST